MISKKDVYMLNAKTSVRVPMMKLSLLKELRQQLKQKIEDIEKFVCKTCECEFEDTIAVSVSKLDSLIDEVLGVEGSQK